MSKKVTTVIYFFLFINMVLFSNVNASTKLDGIKKFPRDYQGYLQELSNKHPEWQFRALYTGLDWNYAISQEIIYGKNLVPKNYSDSWKNTTPGQYDIEVDKGWVDSSKEAVEFCMDPRNFLIEDRVFQFEALSYEPYSNNIEGIEKILYGTEFYNTQVSYLDSVGNNINMDEKYSDLILKAGQISRCKSISSGITY